MDLLPAGPDGLFRAAPGGSPANVAVGLARLGVPTAMLARLSTDLLGRRLRAHLVANGVDVSLVVPAPEPSTLAIVALDEAGVAGYDFRVTGTADWQWRDAEVEGVLTGAVALHSGSLALALPPGATVLRRLMVAARDTATVSYDPNIRPALMGRVDAVRTAVESMVATADVVKASIDDVAWLYPGRRAADVVLDWASRGPAMVAVTLGADGVVAAARDSGLVHRAGRPVVVADTVGAGDSFTSGLLAGLHARALLGARARTLLTAVSAATLGEVLDLAVLAASITCTRPGADPPTVAEMHSAAGGQGSGGHGRDR